MSKNIEIIDNWYDEDGYFHCENCDTCPKFDGENCLMPNNII